MKHPVFIPSKGRPECKAARLLLDSGIKPTLIIFESEHSDYLKNFGKECKYLFCNRPGISEARNAAIKAGSKSGFVWQLDDDITGFRLGTERGKSVKVSPLEAFDEVEREMKVRKNIAMASIDTASFPYSGVPVKMNYKCMSVFCVSTRTGLAFRSLKEVGWDDLDFSIQLLHSGFKTMMVSKVRYFAMGHGGDITTGAAISLKQRSENMKRLADTWPQYMRFNEKNPGMSTASVWRHFREEEE